MTRRAANRVFVSICALGVLVAFVVEWQAWRWCGALFTACYRPPLLFRAGALLAGLVPIVVFAWIATRGMAQTRARWIATTFLAAQVGALSAFLLYQPDASVPRVVSSFLDFDRVVPYHVQLAETLFSAWLGAAMLVIFCRPLPGALRAAIVATATAAFILAQT